MPDKLDWHVLEKKTMTGDHFAALRVVNALRTYRAATTALLLDRHPDGTVDAAALNIFANSIEDLRDAGT